MFSHILCCSVAMLGVSEKAIELIYSLVSAKHSRSVTCDEKFVNLGL